MLADDIRWKEEYAIGIPQLDNAHEQLFRFARRLTLLSEDKSKFEWIAQEGIKFLKIYVIRHFSEEEEFMRLIGYDQIEMHIRQHTGMREQILPRIENRLRNEKYSREAIEKFVYIIQMWLVKHILAYDTVLADAYEKQ